MFASGENQGILMLQKMFTGDVKEFQVKSLTEHSLPCDAVDCGVEFPSINVKCDVMIGDRSRYGWRH